MSQILESNLPKEDRVRRNTAGKINTRLDDELKGRVQRYKGESKEELAGRIRELDNEWDIERFLEMNASALALAGLVLGILGRKRWLLLSLTVMGFLLQHALQGWCPPVPAFRRFGIRTRQEIDREKYALKALRGDFEGEDLPL